MRISDWSSDVCSSDLPLLVIIDQAGARRFHQQAENADAEEARLGSGEKGLAHGGIAAVAGNQQVDAVDQGGDAGLAVAGLDDNRPGFAGAGIAHGNDSTEEPTSELQSLMRI